MPFERFFPRSFTLGAIRSFVPAASGVYGLSNAREWIYIGESDNIQGALMAHLDQPDSALMRFRPKGFVFEICDGVGRVSRQYRLVSEYGPVCNRKSPELV